MKTRSRTATRIGLALTAATVGVALVVPAVHAEPVTAHAAAGLCDKLPDVIARVDKRIARLEGDASVQGSLAWVKAAIAKAQAADRPKLAAAMQRVFDRRSAELVRLHNRHDRLQVATDKCATHTTGG